MKIVEFSSVKKHQQKELINEIGVVVNNSYVGTVAICNNHLTLYLLSTCRNGSFNDFFNF